MTVEMMTNQTSAQNSDYVCPNCDFSISDVTLGTDYWVMLNPVAVAL